MRSKFIEELEKDIREHLKNKVSDDELKSLNLLFWYYEEKFKAEIKKAHFSASITNEANFSEYYKSHFLSQE
jgi:hypothetical protein